MENESGGVLHFSQEGTTIIEMGPGRSGTSAQQACRAEYLRILFGLPEEQLREYPGTVAYCRYLETCFEPLLSEQYASMWSGIGKPIPQVAGECWGFVHAVCAFVPSMTNESSIEEVCSTFIHAEGSRDTARELCSVAVFSVFCWATMALQPELHWSGLEGSPGRPSLMVQQQSMDPKSVRIESVTRPLPAIFHQFRRAMITSRWRHRIGETGVSDQLAALELSCLNYSCLKAIAKIRLVWVEDLASHLDFDAAERTLSVFRFPTFCVLSILRQPKKKSSVTVMLQRGPIRELFGANTGVAEESSYSYEQLHREILLSYRLLFGQTRGSRRLARGILGRLKADNKTDFDSMLDVVCTLSYRRIRSLPLSLWPVTCRTDEGFLQEQSSYSSQDDFPLFGPRLTKLQQFNLRQQPSKLSDLWRDRRNPLQWYTFWAVLLVGGVSIILSIAQLGVGIAQLRAN